MPQGPDVQTAQSIGEKLKLGVEIRALVIDLYQQIPTPFEVPRAYRIDQSWDLIVLPGWNELNPISDYVFLASRQP